MRPFHLPLGHLTHENIIRVHGLLCTDNIVVMLQELATGGDLFDEIDFGYGLPAEKAASILRDIAAALQYIHYPVQQVKSPPHPQHLPRVRSRGRRWDVERGHGWDAERRIIPVSISTLLP